MSAFTDQMQGTKKTRAELVDELIQRDGLVCKYPGDEHSLSFNSTGKDEITIDHFMPQYWCKNNNWTQEEIWDLSNLKLMCKKHNAKKGDLIPNDDGTLPEKVTRKFRYRRDKRAGRPDYCDQCDNGHNLLIGEYCASCGCDAQRFPRWAKVRVPECDHELSWCWACSIGVIERAPAFETAMRQGMSGGEYGEESENENE